MPCDEGSEKMKKTLICLLLALALVAALEPHVRGKIMETASGLLAQRE